MASRSKKNGQCQGDFLLYIFRSSLPGAGRQKGRTYAHIESFEGQSCRTSPCRASPDPKSPAGTRGSLVHKDVGLDGLLTVFESGYTVFQSGKRHGVFHVHDCGDYEYSAAHGKGDVIAEEYFDGREWHLRALLQGETVIQENVERTEQAGNGKNVSYSAISEEWERMADLSSDTLERLIDKETVTAMLHKLTDKQRNLVHHHVILGKPQREIAREWGVSYGTIHRMFQQAMSRILRTYDFEAHYGLAGGLAE